MFGRTDIQKHGANFRCILCNEKDLSKGATYLNTDMAQYYDDKPLAVGQSNRGGTLISKSW